MWANAFNDDDTLNPILADKYGIVMGTSHHEPMLRAQQEWKRYGKGPWNYDSNEVVLKDFWKKGIEHMGNRESKREKLWSAIGSTARFEKDLCAIVSSGRRRTRSDPVPARACVHTDN